MAPTTADTISPKSETAWMPRSPKTQPPTIPPTMPRMRSTIHPLPSLLVSFHAIKPAIIPNIILVIIILYL